tara:strand:+ start:8433 stop:8840 length:408 start_codon:yes stop_codon:yes gene_type:complete
VDIKLKIGIGLLIGLAVAFISLLYFRFDPSEIGFFPKCPVYAFTGYYCSGCGSQRAIHEFLHGKILAGLKHNFLILLLAIVLLYDVFVKLAQTFFNKTFNNLLQNSKTTYIILFMIILFGILRNINVYPFTVLAP